MGLLDLLSKSAKSKKKINRRGFFRKTGQLAGLAALTKVLSSCNGGNGNGNNHTEYDILTNWRANYTLEGTEASGIVKYYNGGTYNPDTNTGTLVKQTTLGTQEKLGTTIDNGTKSFDVVVEADDGLRKVYKNIAMSKTKEYYDQKEGVLKLSNFNLGDYVKYWLDPENQGIRVINRWNQNTIASEFNPDISATTLSGQTLFNMVTDFMPSKQELKQGMTYKQALERGVQNARNKLKGRKYVVLYDGSDFDNREALIKWGEYLRRDISEIAEVKDLYQARYEGLDKIAAQGYEILQLNAKRLSDAFIDEIIKWLKHVKDLSNGVITNFPEPVRLGNRTAADLQNIPNGASWSFYDSLHNLGNGTYPTSGGAVNANQYNFNSDRVPLFAVREEVFDGFFGKDQDYWPANVEDWIRFSFTRPVAGAEGHSINENYETRNGVPSGVSVQSGALQAVEVSYNSYQGNDTLSNMGSFFGPNPVIEKRVIRDLGPVEDERLRRIKREEKR